MSATGRGSDRQPDDFYATPLWPIELIAPELPRTGDILDPGCGGGAILQHLRGQGFDESKMFGVELREERAGEARLALPKARIVTADFLTPIVGPVAHPFALSVFNPPYTLALEFVQQSLRYTEPIEGTTAALLRLNWMGSQARASFHREHPCDIVVLDERPEFVASVSCKNKKGGCTYRVTLPIKAPRPRECPTCGKGVNVTTTDATEYAWMLWGPGRGNRWSVLSRPKKVVVPKEVVSKPVCAWCGKPKPQCRTLGLPGCDPHGGPLPAVPAPLPALLGKCMTCREVPVDGGAPKRCPRCEAFAISEDAEDVTTPFSGRDLDLLPQVMFTPGPNPFGVPSDASVDAFCNLCFGAQYATPEGPMCIYLHKTLPILREYKPTHATWCNECQKIVHESLGCDHRPAGDLIVPGCAACENGTPYGGEEDFKHTGTGSYCKEPSRPRVSTGDTTHTVPARSPHEEPTHDRGAAPSRRRGRPPGSKNKKKGHDEAQWAAAEDIASWVVAEDAASEEIRRQQDRRLADVIDTSLVL